MGKWINIDDLPSGRVEWEDLFGAPSIDIVRCKECKRWSYSDLIESHNRCERTMKLTKADDFCSYGVRKTNTTAEEKPTPIRDYMVHGERKESE